MRHQDGKESRDPSKPTAQSSSLMAVSVLGLLGEQEKELGLLGAWSVPRMSF